MITLLKNFGSFNIQILGNVKLLPDYGLYSVLAQSLYKSVRAVHIAVVCNGYGVHSHSFKSLAQRMQFFSLVWIILIYYRLNKAHRAVQQTVFGMKMQMYKIRHNLSFGQRPVFLIASARRK